MLEARGREGGERVATLLASFLATMERMAKVEKGKDREAISKTP